MSLEHRRAKTDGLDTELQKRGCLGWQRGHAGRVPKRMPSGRTGSVSRSCQNRGLSDSDMRPARPGAPVAHRRGKGHRLPETRGVTPKSRRSALLPDPAIRSAAYREGGWPSFENAPTDAADQIAAERSTDLATAARGFTSVHRFHRRQNNLSFSNNRHAGSDGTVAAPTAMTTAASPMSERVARSRWRFCC